MKCNFLKLYACVYDELCRLYYGYIKTVQKKLQEMKLLKNFEFYSRITKSKFLLIIAKHIRFYPWINYTTLNSLDNCTEKSQNMDKIKVPEYDTYIFSFFQLQLSICAEEGSRNRYKKGWLGWNKRILHHINFDFTHGLEPLSILSPGFVLWGIKGQEKLSVRTTATCLILERRGHRAGCLQ